MLGHERDLLAQARQPIATEGFAIEEDLARCRLVEARDQAGQRRLATSGSPHERHRLTRLHGKRYVRDHRRFARLVAEGHFLEADRPLHALDGEATRVLLGVLVELSEDVDGGGQAPLQACVDIREPLDRVGQEARQPEIADDLAG